MQKTKSEKLKIANQAIKKQKLKAITEQIKVNQYHRKYIIPLVIKKLKQSKLKIVSASEISNSLLKNHGLKVPGSLVRSLLHYIRINGLVKCVIATNKGYYITNNTLEMVTYLKSIQRRIKQIAALKAAIYSQSQEILGKQFKTSNKLAA